MHPTSTKRRQNKDASATVSKSADNKTVNAELPTDRNLKAPIGRMRLDAYSLPSLKEVMGNIYESARAELRYPQAAHVFHQMTLDPNIASALALTEATISKAEWTVTAPMKASQADKDIAEKINYNLLIMERDFHDYVSELLSYLTYGYCASEKIYTKYTDLPVGDFIGLKDLRTISQASVDKWIFDTNTGELLGLKQNVGQLSASIERYAYTAKLSKEDIPRKKFLLVNHNTKRNNPEGVSPLVACYIIWKYKTLLEESETIYASKGMGGILDLGVSVSYLAKAAMDATSDEAAVLQDLQKGAANFHNGDQSYVITPLAYDDRGNPLFYSKLLETKPPSIDPIIKRHDHRILQTFFADVLMLGSDGSGSFALSEDKSSLLMIGIKAHLNRIQRMLNKDLIPQMYELNGWKYDARTCARFEYKDIEDGDLEVLAGAVQKILAVDAVDRTEDIEDYVRDKFFDLPPRAEANTKVRVIEESNNTSRSGDGMTSGLSNGTGDSTSSGGDRSSSNLAN